MSYQISQRFFFDSAHTLRREIEADTSRRIHGHTYQAEIMMAGEPDAATGMVLDLGRVRQAIAGLRDQLDHRMLDDIAGLGPATLENLCAFIWRQLAPTLPGLSGVRVWRDALGDACLLTRSPDSR
jgi:6-pyruvoyltetrahydropterin/6-carboxytetrahydropterin synthase